MREMLKRSASEANTAESRDAFQNAADTYDTWQGDVAFDHRPAGANYIDTGVWQGGRTAPDGSYVVLNSALQPGDFALTAVHESFHMRGIPGTPFGEELAWRGTASAFGGMVFPDKNTALQHRVLFREKGLLP